MARRLHLWLTGPLLVVFVVLAAANPMESAVHGDGYYTYLWARTIVLDGDLDFHEDYRVCPDPWRLANAPVADDVNYWNMGPALFWIPILAVEYWTRGDRPGSVHELRACNGPLPEHAVFGSLFAGLLAAWLGFSIARRYVRADAAWVGAFVGALATPLSYYATMMLSYGHAASAMACGLFVWAWDRSRVRAATGENAWRAWALMGAALGFAMLMRTQNAVMVILPFATWLQGAWRQRHSTRTLLLHALRGVLFTACIALVFSPQITYWWNLMGSPFGIPQGEHYMRWGQPRIMQALFSTGAGLFTWSPVFYVALAGWIILAYRRTTRPLGLALLALFVVSSYVAGSVYDWWGSVGYPGRRFDMMFVPAMVGIAAAAGALAQLALRHRGMPAVAIAMLLFLPFSIGLDAGIAQAARIDVAGTAPTKWGWINDRVAKGVWKAVGNPLAWPASLPFALRWNVHPRDWDVLGSQELFYHDHQTLVRREFESTLRAGLAENDGYFGGSFEDKPSRVAGRDVRIARKGSGRILIPLHWPDLGGVRLRARPVGGDEAVVGLRVNGVPCGVQRLRGPGDVHFEVPSGVTDHGINELWLYVGEASVAVETLELLDPDPPPSVEQRRRNEALRAARADRN